MQEGWGLTFDGEQLIATDSLNKLFKLNPHTLKLTQTTNVTRKYPNGLI